MTLETFEPNPVWVAEAYDETVSILDAYSEEVQYRIWGGDWCKDCRAKLPDFSAALDAASVPEEHVEIFELDQNKQGLGVGEYGIEQIPTVIVEHENQEIARYVESESAPIAVYLADQLASELGDPTA